MKPKISFVITKEDKGYSAFAQIGQYDIFAEGDNYTQLQKSILDAVNITFDEDGHTYNMHEIELKYDLPSFFDFYKVINAKALSERIGMNQSLLAQYISGKKRPGPAQIRRIITGVNEIGRELADIDIQGGTF